jgi:hypothetical protein
MVEQEVATAKNAVSDRRLRELGLYGQASGPHERDALRHALLLASNQRVWRGLAA